MRKDFNSSCWQPGQSIILYQSPKPKNRRLMRFMGLVLLAVPLAVLLTLYSPVIVLELAYRLGTVNPAKQNTLVASPSFSGFGQLLFLNQRGIISPANRDFGLIVPKIGINVPIVSNVDPADEKKYRAALKIGVAHAKDTSLPNGEGTIYLFGHSSNFLWEVGPFNQVFYLLPKLEKDDEIILVFQGKNFVYKVSEKRVAEAKETFYLVSDKGEKLLVLQTCWPPGTDWKRYLVIAKPV